MKYNVVNWKNKRKYIVNKKELNVCSVSSKLQDVGEIYNVYDQRSNKVNLFKKKKNKLYF